MERACVCPPSDFSLYAFDEEAHNELLHTLQQHHQRLRLEPSSSSSSSSSSGNDDNTMLSPVVFTDVWISDLALTKMMLHAEKGGKIEVMGLLLGRAVSADFGGVTSAYTPTCTANTTNKGENNGDIESKRGYFTVTDCFALPVEGTETRVNAAEEANEYMVNFLEEMEKTNLKQKVIGWYHSHPNYGCWLSGIDVRTQQLQQQHQDPFLAIVVDPIRTLSSGCVEIGAFRTFLPGEKKKRNEHETNFFLPEEKAHDFGVHWQNYYQLRIHFCLSSLNKKIINKSSSGSWPELLGGVSIRRNKPLEMRRLEAVAEACRGAVAAAQYNELHIKGNINYETEKPVVLPSPDYLADYNLKQIKQIKSFCLRLAAAADTAGETALRVLLELAEIAAMNAVYHDSSTWEEYVELARREEKGDM